MNAVSFVPCTPMCQIMSLPCSRCTRATFSPFDPPLDPGCFMAQEVQNENLPGYVVLRPSPNIVVGPALWSNSFLPAKYQATSILTSDLKVDRLIRHIRNPIHDLKNQRQQLDLVQALNRRHQWMRSDQGDLKPKFNRWKLLIACKCRQPMQPWILKRNLPISRRCMGHPLLANPASWPGAWWRRVCVA